MIQIYPLFLLMKKLVNLITLHSILNSFIVFTSPRRARLLVITNGSELVVRSDPGVGAVVKAAQRFPARYAKDPSETAHEMSQMHLDSAVTEMALQPLV